MHWIDGGGGIRPAQGSSFMDSTTRVGVLGVGGGGEEQGKHCHEGGPCG